ncbi:MAG: histidine phosphatase family protein [Rubrivivax sp.]|jgi:probable phosphoglycerate mutase|nr:histidine phosphatase family protein [Rubrivivax sp.]
MHAEGGADLSAAATRVIAVRHGQTAWNAALRIQGHTDIPLDERGRWQAARLAQALAHETVHAVYSSDLQRARDTARAYAAGAGLAVHDVPGLRERRFGHFEGLSFDDIERHWPDDARRWRRREPDFAPGDGESLRDFHHRCVAACAALAARHRGQTILVVAHGGVLDCLYRAATRTSVDAPRSWQLGNATVNRLLHTDAGFTLVGWNDEQHLADDAP